MLDFCLPNYCDEDFTLMQLDNCVYMHWVFNWTLLESIDICHITVILAANNCRHLSTTSN